MTATVAAPRPKSLSRAAVVAVALLLSAAGVFLAAVWTPTGQRIDQWLLELGRQVPATDIPPILRIDVVSSPLLWLAVAAVVVVLIQLRRFRARSDARRTLTVTAALIIFPPVAVLCARVLRDHVLTRPQLHDWIAETANSAPSGHAAAVAAVAVVLVLATPPRLRVLTTIVVGGWAAIIGLELIAAGWHRPSDVLISVLLVAAAGVLLPDPWRPSVRSHRTGQTTRSSDRPSDNREMLSAMS
ncbi:phosphatase PAP2 family protein [Gordonia insulae]|uniref:Phosphatidic acid phosphatase type 2/haloperoxidase domain-containing protein n=1 Tax=Gordonia insulae TaxID=2420509 RepID=A0A3G8JQI6_9ACTN|nr:phosphatase PAP2 family protein [Gordonia insulae]AZG47246.1 hypothetical protein D7316_03854 [Gordonia insulae]